MRKEDVHL